MRGAIAREGDFADKGLVAESLGAVLSTEIESPDTGCLLIKFLHQT